MDMEHQFFTTLPTEIVTNIFTRVPCKTIGTCKCVCKSWLGLLDTPEFAKYHLSKSVPQLIVYLHFSPKLLKVFELVDKVDLESHELHYNPLGHEKFIDAPYSLFTRLDLEGSANGLLFLCKRLNQPDFLYVCNPVTREYIQLPDLDCYERPALAVYGFGVSMMSNQYKVVRILQEFVRDSETGGMILSIPRSECRVYTLGTTKSWRSLAHSNSYAYIRRSTAVFINGNLHWLVADFNRSLFVSCFDLETEQFKFFAAPPSIPGRLTITGDIAFFDNCLCICDNTTSYNEIDIWAMKEYGIEKSWAKLMVISRIPGIDTRNYPIYPLKLFKDGDVLMLFRYFFMFCYSSKTNTTARFKLFEHQAQDMVQARLHVLSFLSLKSFAMETVSKY